MGLQYLIVKCGTIFPCFALSDWLYRYLYNIPWKMKKIGFWWDAALMVYSEFTSIWEESACFHAEGTRVNSSEVFWNSEVVYHTDGGSGFLWNPYQRTWCHILENCIFQRHHHDILKSHTVQFSLVWAEIIQSLKWLVVGWMTWVFSFEGQELFITHTGCSLPSHLSNGDQCLHLHQVLRLIESNSMVLMLATF